MADLLAITGLESNPIIIVISAVCLYIIALANFTDALIKLSEFFKNIFDRISDLDISDERRQFLCHSTVLMVLICGGGFSFKYIYTKRKNRSDCNSKLDPSGYLIYNKKNGVVHHSRICKFHLPDEKNQSLSFYKIKNAHPHNYQGLNLYEVMAQQKYKSDNLYCAVIYLKKAINITPERIHLYDRLAKIYGKQKEYILIKKLYEDGVKKISSKLKTQNNKHQLSKVKRDLQSRVDRINKKYT